MKEYILETLKIMTKWGMIVLAGFALVVLIKQAQYKERKADVQKFNKEHQTVKTCNLLEKEKVTDEWQDLINAIAFVESTNNPKAKNGQSVGLLQITPIYVAECNRILGEERYTLADREDSLKSIEMFKIYTQYHADVQNIEKTIHVHNPRGGQKYINKVLNQMSVK